MAPEVDIENLELLVDVPQTGDVNASEIDDIIIITIDPAINRLIKI